jgi:3-deoxy-manno-octulosonate cytidylyltransferase (CMP-KDO synthetase)
LTIHEHKIIGVIPARYGSTRFPGKPLALINGKPMIQHVYERAMKSKLLSKVIVATDDKRIYNAVKGFEANVEMTSKQHKSGTDRVGEVIKNVKCDIVVNIQGDEPFIDPRNIDKAIESLINEKTVNVSTLCCKITDKSEVTNSNVVKVIFDKNNFALYFSRLPVPYSKSENKTNYYKHIGLYVFRKRFLIKFLNAKRGRLEKIEKLEQLRILEMGERIKVVLTKKDSIAIDTKTDLRKIKS